MKIFHKILCLLDEHTPKNYCETEQGLKPKLKRDKFGRFCGKKVM